MCIMCLVEGESCFFTLVKDRQSGWETRTKEMSFWEKRFRSRMYILTNKHPMPWPMCLLKSVKLVSELYEICLLLSSNSCQYITTMYIYYIFLIKYWYIYFDYKCKVKYIELEMVHELSRSVHNPFTRPIHSANYNINTNTPNKQFS